MRKALIIFLLITASGCSVQRIGYVKRDIGESKDVSQIIERIKGNNITNGNFFIQNGDILLKTGNETQKFKFTIKYKKPDVYLISMKNNLGIEGARIYLSDDTLLINDRINRRVLYGSPEEIRKFYGMPAIILQLLLGEVIITKGTVADKIESVDKKLILYQYKEGMTGRSVINSKLDKISRAEWTKGPGGKGIIFNYSKFDKKDKHVPEKVEYISRNDSIYARIYIKKIQLEWEGEIEFIPGNGYKKEEIK